MEKMLVNRATGIVREPIQRPVRKGKTKRDHDSGSWLQHIKNRVARGDKDRDGGK